MEKVRQIIYFKDYFLNFFNEQTEKVKEKIDHVLFVVTVTDRIPKKFFDILPEQKDFIKSELSFRVIFTGYSVVLMRGKLLCYSTVFKKNHKRHLNQKLKEH